MQKIQAFLNLMTMKKEREEREGKESYNFPLYSRRCRFGSEHGQQRTHRVLNLIHIHPGRVEYRQMPDNQKGSLRVRVCAMKRVRVRYHHPIHIMDVSERSDTCLVHDKQYQQAQCTYNFFLLLHVQKLIL